MMLRTRIPIATLAVLAALAPGVKTQEAARPATPAQRCTITGSVVAGQTRLPGVAITVAPASGGAPVTTSTGPDGRFSVVVPAPGEYALKADLASFFAEPVTVTLGTPCQAQADFTMTLASRVAAPARPAAAPPSVAATPTPPGRPQTPAAGTPAGRRPQAPQFQPLAPVMDVASGAAGDPAAATAETLDREAAAQLSLPPGFSLEGSGAAVTATGSSGQMNNALLFGMMGEGPMGREGMPGGGDFAMGGAAMGPASGFGDAAGFFGAGGGMGGPGGGMGGPAGAMGGRGGGGDGGRGGGPGIPRLGMAGRMGNNRPRGTVSYTLGGSMLNAAPYSLTGQPVEEPQFLQQRIAANVGGPVKIPGWFDFSQNTNFFLNYSGNHSDRPIDTYSTVPSAAMRSGDFSGTTGIIRDPLTGQPFPGNQIPADRISSTAQTLLPFIPLPNSPGDRQNFYYSTTAATHSDDINVRLMRSFGSTQRRPGQAAARPAAGGAGGRGGGRGGASLSVGVNYSHSKSIQTSAFPTTGGSTRRSAWNVPVSFNFAKWGIMNAVRFQFNRSNSTTTNRYAYSQDISGEAGIIGISDDAFDWGLPNLSFSSISSLRDSAPSSRIEQTLTFGDTMTKMKGRHTMRWGADLRLMSTDSRVNTNPRGTFVFTGVYTGGTTGSAAGRNNDFADFLLGLTQQATVQYGPGLQLFRASSVNVFFQDDWRVSNRFTINAGLRYEYLSPYSEEENRLVTLDVNPTFTAAAPVVAGQTGPYSGAFVNTIVRPDRNNLAPRVGFAWKPETKTTVRGGYGISYSSPVYYSIVQRLAGQPPFAVTDTRLATGGIPIVMATAFAEPNTIQTTNNFAIDPNYTLGWVQMWNLDVQRDVTRTIFAGVGYTGTKGTSLDLQRAPNRGPSGLTIPDVLPFIWETSDGRSIMHALNVRLRKRMSRGFSAGLSYTFSKSLDDASTIGGGNVVVAQDDRNLAAEWGVSSFDQRHRLSADYSIQLPFGPNRRWLNRESWLAHAFGGWMWNGSVSYSSGTPYTARILGNSSDVSRGTYGTLRADYNGQPITIDNPSILQFFNTAAFSVPLPGTFGNAGRNTITGPSSTNVNMTVMKSFSLGGTRTMSVQVQGNNVFNMAQWGSIDTVVNSPTFGRVVSMRSMRTVQLVARLGF